MGASRGGGSDIVEKHLGAVRQLKRSLEVLEDVAECGVTAVDEGWKKEWTELCDWERVGAPLLDGGEGKQRWRRQRRRGRVGNSACSGEGIRERTERQQRSTTSTACGTSVKTSQFHQPGTNGTSSVAHGSTSADISTSCQLGNTSTNRATSGSMGVLPQPAGNASSREHPPDFDEVQPPLPLIDRNAAGYEPDVSECMDGPEYGEAKPSKPAGLIWSEDDKHSSGCGRMEVMTEADVAGGSPPQWSMAPENPGLRHATLRTEQNKTT